MEDFKHILAQSHKIPPKPKPKPTFEKTETRILIIYLMLP